jgi:flagellar basal-body rod modification protein FlgD
MSSIGITPSTPPVGTATPTVGSPGSAVSNKKAALGKSEFLKLLVAQMKHQDPLNPTGGDQMAAQLAQFSSLEQLQNINAALDSQGAGQVAVVATLQNSAALSTLGKTVVAQGDQIDVPTGVDPRGLSVSAKVDAGGGSAVLKITDANGTIVGQRSLGSVGTGPLEVSLGDAAKGLAPGAYHFAIGVTDSKGSPVTVTTYTVGKVDRIQATASGPVLYAGPISIPFANVTEIRN